MAGALIAKILEDGVLSSDELGVLFGFCLGLGKLKFELADAELE